MNLTPWLPAERPRVHQLLHLQRTTADEVLDLLGRIMLLQANGTTAENLVSSVADTGFPVGDVPPGPYEALVFLELFANMVREGPRPGEDPF
jgi:hypothetical protein